MNTNHTFNTQALTHWDIYVPETARLLHDATGYPIKRALHKVAWFYDEVINEFIRMHLYANSDMIELGRYHFAKSRISVKLHKFVSNSKTYKLFKTIQELNPLFFDIELGNNISHKISLVQVIPSFQKVINNALTNSTVVTNALLGDYMEDGFLCIKHEKVSIDANSLRNARGSFIDDETGEIKEYSVKVANYLLCLNDVFGYIPHVPNESDFGRKYYRMINLQGAPKEVRNAAMPNAIEVDINSCSNEFLMQSADMYGVSCNYLKMFSAEKQSVREEITKMVFGIDKNSKKFKDKLKLIKQCITALGFNARLSSGNKSAISNLLKDKCRVNWFNHHPFIRGYYNDINNITKAFIDANEDRLSHESFLFSNDNIGMPKVIPSKFMAYGYQHFERNAMDTAFAGFERNIKLMVHDGCYVEGMDEDDLNVVESRFAKLGLTISVE